MTSPGPPAFEPKDENYVERMRQTFEAQSAMAALGVQIEEVKPGFIAFSLLDNPSFRQQHGFLHGGAVATVLDSACGFAAFTLMPADAEVLTVEFKVNFLAPAKGETFRIEGLVIKPGRTITLAEGRAYATENGQQKLIATMTATLMTITGRNDVKQTG
ncbi:MAG: PaaI family thioesterase [Pseudomonadota bacterium]